MKTISRFLLSAGMALALAFTFSCSSDDDGDGGGNGEGNNIASYRTEKIGDQTWMASNLNYEVEGSICYLDDPANCAKYGRLYDWATAMDLPVSCNDRTNCASQINAKHRGICPEGWHIPSKDEWEELLDAVGGWETAGKHLKATSGWNWEADEGKSGNGLDTYGFKALPGGYGDRNGPDYVISKEVGYYGFWWSSSASVDNSYGVYYLKLDNRSERADLSSFYTKDLRSIRCIKD